MQTQTPISSIFSLAGRRALACGSTQGIGRATAILFAQLGASVTLAGRNQQSLQAVRDGLANDGKQNHDFVVADFNRPEEVSDVVTRHVAATGPIHILLNNTGGPPGGAVLTARPEEFTVAFARHLLCNQLLAQSLVPGMRSAGYGRIINVISTSVKEPIPGLGVSNTIRAAVANWAKTLSREVAAFGITVNNVLPGATDTGRLQEIINNKARSAGVSVDQARKEMISHIPMGRLASPDEIAAVAGFLASPAAS